MTNYVFDIAAFREAYPEFSDTVLYPDDLLNRNWTSAGCFISNCKYGRLSGDCRYTALTMMVAHLTKLGKLIKAGVAPRIVNSSSISMVSVSLTPPPVASQFSWWLNTTPYGAELLVLLQMKASGGFYVTSFYNVTRRTML